MSKDAKPDAWMPLFIGDWTADTQHLSCEQDGAYFRLVRHYWRTGPLPDDDAVLARLTGLELKAWRKHRATLAAFFQIGEGRWRHKRVDAELVRWEEKRRRAIERASAGGRAKAAKSSATSSATSTQQAVLKKCTSASPREEEGPNSPSSLSGQNEFLGPKEVRDAFRAKLGEEWCCAYLDRCGWQDVPDRALIPATKTAGSKLIRDGRPVLASLGLIVVERAA